MINLNKPKYILPLIVLPFIYVFYYLYKYISPKDEVLKTIPASTSINPALPDPFLDEDNLMDKFDAFREAYKNRRNFSAIQEIDRREEKPVTTDEISAETAKAPVYTSQIRKPVYPGNRKQQLDPYKEQMKLFKAQMSYVDSLLAAPSASFRSSKEDMSKSGDGEIREQIEEDLRLDEVERVKLEVGRSMTNNGEKINSQWSKEHAKPNLIKKSNGSGSSEFTILTKKQSGSFIKAIIDQDLKVTKSSRIRLRLLDDIVIGDHSIPKGQHLYGLITAFKPQRVEVQITSVLHQGKIMEVSLDIYDLDGMKGLYVPESRYRELAKSMGEDMTGGGQLNLERSPNNKMQLMYGLARDAFNTTTEAASKAIRKQKARLKYNTQVYLVNTQGTSTNNQHTL